MTGNTWLEIIAGFFVLSGFFTALILVLYTRRYHPTMKIMEFVWPLTGLWGSWAALWGYFRFGKTGHAMNMSSSQPMEMEMKMKMQMPMSIPSRPLWEKIALSTLHCGAGCTLADIIGEWFTFFVPVYIGNSLIAGQWVLDFILALIIGIFFQYAAIQPMEHLPARKAIVKAFKVDFLSLASWQIGMYCWMGIALFGIYGAEALPKNSWAFWFMMQIAMFFGFMTAYPVNRLLIKKGIKHSM